MRFLKFKGRKSAKVHFAHELDGSHYRTECGKRVHLTSVDIGEEIPFNPIEDHGDLCKSCIDAVTRSGVKIKKTRKKPS